MPAIKVKDQQGNDFVMKRQNKMNWCWAAVSSSVVDFFDAHKHSVTTECSIATHCLSKETGRQLSCCDDSQPCNRDFRLDQALETTGHLNKVEAGTLTFAQIQAEIEAGRPVGVRVEWMVEKTGHFLAITGYDSTPAHPEQVLVDDPFYGPARVPFDQFKEKYLGEGVWTHTYKVKGTE